MADKNKENASNELAIEKLKVLGNVLTVLITVGIGTFGVALVNRDYQNRQLEQLAKENAAALELQQKKADSERRQAEMKYLGEYVVYALETDIAKRLRFAEYFAALTISDDLKTRWEKYRDHLQGLVDQQEKLTEKISEATTKRDFEKSAELQRDLSKLAPLVDQLSPTTDLDYEALFTRGRTDELKLSRYGEQAFERGNYEWTIKFLTQAKKVQASKVWQSSYPYLIGAYLMMNEDARAQSATEEMFQSMGQEFGYLTSDTTQGFVLSALGQVREQISPEYSGFIDEIIDRVIAIKTN